MDEVSRMSLAAVTGREPVGHAPAVRVEAGMGYAARIGGMDAVRAARNRAAVERARRDDAARRAELKL